MNEILLFDNPQNEADSDFAELHEKVDKLLPILSAYYYEDLVKAIFCINSWRNNRSCFESTSSLNVGLIEHNQSGTDRINTYKEFKDFFNKIKLILQPNILDDLTLNDFGEVKVKYKGNVYPVILGTGYEATYCMLEFIPETCDNLSCENTYQDLLKYTSKIIESLQNYNVSGYSTNSICFEIPSSKYYKSICELFKQDFVPNSDEKFVQILSANPKKERRHFVVKGNKVYPLFNASILADFYSCLIKDMDFENITRLVDRTIFRLIKNNFDQYGMTKDIIYPISTVEDKKFTSPTPCAFLANTQDGFIFAINCDKYKEDELDKEIKKIRELHNSNNLFISEIVSRDKNHEYLGIHIPIDKKLHIIVYNSKADITQGYSVALGRSDYHFFTSLDIVFFLNIIEDFNELQKYLDFKDKEKGQILISGSAANHYVIWKSQSQMIVKGALEYSLLNIGYGETDNFIYDYFTKELLDYPFNSKFDIFAYPFSWNIKNYEDGYKQYNSKSQKTFLGYGKELKNNNYLFLGHNVTFFEESDFTVENREKIYVLDAINAKLFNKFSDLLCQLFSDYHLYFLYMPTKYAKKVDNNGFTKTNKEYVHSDARFENYGIMFRYTCDLDKIIKDIQNATNKSVEIKYLVELLSPLKNIYPDKFPIIENEIMSHINEKKEVDTFAMSIEYYYSSKSSQFIVDDIYFDRAKKELAKICLNVGIKPGNYKKQDAFKIFEKIEKDIVKFLENKLSEYSQKDLTSKILEMLSTTLHVTFVDNDRYSRFSNVDDSVLEEVKNKALNEREQYKRHTRALYYLLEENLYVNRTNNNVCKREDFLEMCAYADWLVCLHDNAAACYFSKENIQFSFDHEYLVDITVPEAEKEKYKKLQKRIYDYKEYIIKNDEIDKKFIEKAVSSFEKDTTIDFVMIIDLLFYLSLPQPEETFFTEESPNVFSLEKEILISEFQKKTNNVYVKEKILLALDFLTIVPSNLKIVDGQEYPSIPIWNRESRNNRIDVKPLISSENKYIFSTVMCYELRKRWQNGLLNFYPPYEIGLSDTMKVLKNWKRRYEELMVEDLSNELKELKIGVIFKEKMLNKIDPAGRSHPVALGDYDILIFDIHKKIIWNIECKFVQKVGSVFETSMQQKDFFDNTQDSKSYATKFQRRIDYLSKKENYIRVIKSLDFTKDDYEIKSIMVTNKVLGPLGYSVNFEIMSYYEFVDYFKNFYDLNNKN